MLILKKKSIKELGMGSAGPFYEMASNFQKESIISFTIRSFEYFSSSENSFDINDLRAIFYEENTDQIIGKITTSTYLESKNSIELNLFCSWLADKPTTKLNIPLELKNLSQQNIEMFWHETRKHFIFPPNRIYQHHPEARSVFSGIFWDFCFIYFNDSVGQGIVLAGQSYD